MSKTLTSMLSTRLQQAEQEQAQALEQLTAETQQQLKRRFESYLSTSNDALTTTQSVIAADQKRIREISAKTTTLLIKDLLALHRMTLRKVKHLLMLPVIAAASLSLMLIATASAWAWWTVHQAQSEAAQARQAADLTRRELSAIEERFCSTPAGRLHCQPKR